MLNFASKCLAGTGGLKFRIGFRKFTQGVGQLSDDEDSSTISKELGLECPICYESFNIVENIPYVLWCGHSLCKNCVLGLRSAFVKMSPLPIQLPLLISCPWCNLLSPRLVLKGNMRFPRKNYFLLWMVERHHDDKMKKSRDDPCSSNSLPSKLVQTSHSDVETPQSSGSTISQNRVARMLSYLQKGMLSFLGLTAKFPLVLICVLIVLYEIPSGAAILALYLLLTILFVLPSFLIFYFAYPSLDWLVKEIMA